jgi:RHS repeat-associated protein
MLARETDSHGELKSYDYDSRGRRLGQSIRPTSLAPSDYRAYADDANGSVVGLEDAQGGFGPAGLDTYLYDPYGEPDKPIPAGTDPTETIDPGLSPAAKDNPFRFEGFYYDAGVRTYDMQARQYRPDVGRFLSEDRYAFAHPAASLGINTSNT